jgi:dUTP pyrophosphatase
MKKILITRNHANAIIPTRGSTGAAGYDLYSTETYVLTPGERKLFKTGLNMAIPSGMYGRIAPRSGLAFKKGIDVLAGVIDEDYRGDVGVILINLGKEDFSISVGDRIAQIIFEFYNPVSFEEQTSQSNVQQSLGSTDRGSGGFGSTDKPNPVEKALQSPYNAFALKKTTTIERFYREHEISPVIKRQYIETHLGQFHGEIYEFIEGSSKGLCVVDQSGTVHNLSKVLLAKA